MMNLNNLRLILKDPLFVVVVVVVLLLVLLFVVVLVVVCVVDDQRAFLNVGGGREVLNRKRMFDRLQN